MQSCRPKICKGCHLEYQPTSRNQSRCETCKANNVGIGEAPLCKCGCGHQVGWSKIHSGRWNIYIKGHEIVERYRVQGKDWLANRVSHNLGQLTTYDHVCDNCGETFTNKFKIANYCSRKCYNIGRSGENSPFWKGGKRTKYVFKNRKREHRTIIEKLLKRQLKEGEVVHHIDENGLNNNIKNLFLFHCDSCHLHHHQTKEPLCYIYFSVHKEQEIQCN